MFTISSPEKVDFSVAFGTEEIIDGKKQKKKKKKKKLREQKRQLYS